MNSLQLRIAMLIVLAIIAVVGLATVAAVSVIGRPGPDRFIGPAAIQIDRLARLVEQRPQDFAPGSGGPDQVVSLMPNPLTTPEDTGLTELLRRTLARAHHPRDVIVSVPVPPAPPMVSVPIEGLGWIAVPLSDGPPPRAGWPVLIGLMLAIVAGAIIIALFFAAKLTRPLRMLDGAIASVGPDGVLPLLPETGSGEVRATARALNRLSARLKTAMDSRMRLVAAAGHDLRTPMTRMRLRAEFLDDEERAHWLKDLDELERIADSAIRLVREEVDEGRPEPLRIDPLLRSLTAELVQQGLKLDLVAPLPAANVAVSPLALTRALRNLMINAAKHGGGGRVALRLEAGFAVITIEDDGPGIPEALLERVFEPFFRVDDARRQSVPGAGLGLAIAKEIIERNRGRIAVRNKSPGGLVQEVWLPVVE